jgi:hypothetical protein
LDDASTSSTGVGAAVVDVVSAGAALVEVVAWLSLA